MPAKQTKQPSVPGAESESFWAFGASSVSTAASEVQVGSLAESRRGQRQELNSPVDWRNSLQENLILCIERRFFLTNDISNLLPGIAKLEIHFKSVVLESPL